MIFCKEFSARLSGVKGVGLGQYHCRQKPNNILGHHLTMAQTNLYEDHSGVVAGTYENPYDALIEASHNDAVSLINLRYKLVLSVSRVSFKPSTIDTAGLDSRSREQNFLIQISRA